MLLFKMYILLKKSVGRLYLRVGLV